MISALLCDIVWHMWNLELPWISTTSSAKVAHPGQAFPGLARPPKTCPPPQVWARHIDNLSSLQGTHQAAWKWSELAFSRSLGQPCHACPGCSRLILLIPVIERNIRNPVYYGMYIIKYFTTKSKAVKKKIHRSLINTSSKNITGQKKTVCERRESARSRQQCDAA